MYCIHIIEDDAELLNLLKIFLVSKGFQVCDDYNGNRIISGEIIPSDLCIIDINLIGKSGLDICTSIRKMNSLKPIILMSANKNLHLLAKECHVSDYIKKPFELNDMMKKIHFHLAA